MKKEILSEINRYREIMGLNLLLENGIPLLSGGKSVTSLSTLSDDLSGILKNTDELMDLADDAALMIEYPVLNEIKEYLIQQESNLGRALEITDIIQLQKVDDIILDYFSTLDPMEIGTRNAFIEAYLENNSLGKVKNTNKINNAFEDASSLGLRELKGLKDVLKREVSASANIPRYMKDLVIADIEGVAKNWEKPKQTNRKFEAAITKSYDDFINSFSTSSGINAEKLKKAVPSKSVKVFKEKLIQNNGDISKTVNQLNREFEAIITKIEETEGLTRSQIFQKWATDQGCIVDSVLGFGPLGPAFEKIKNGKGIGESLSGFGMWAIIVILLGGVSYFVANFSEIGDDTGAWGDKITSEGASLKRKFNNINKVSKFWNEVAVYAKATGKIWEVLGANAIAIEEKAEDNLKREDKFKVTFTFGDSGSLGTMIWLTDNEGEEPIYDYGTGIFPKSPGDVPDVVPVDPTPKENTIAVPTKAEFVTWFNNKFEIQITDDNVTIGTDNITQVTVGSESAKFKKIAEKTFEEIPK